MHNQLDCAYHFATTALQCECGASLQRQVGAPSSKSHQSQSHRHLAPELSRCCECPTASTSDVVMPFRPEDSFDTTNFAIGLRLPRAFRCCRVLSCSTAVAVTFSRSQRFEMDLVAVESAAARAAGELPPSFAVVAAAAPACAACWSSPCCITLS